MNPYRLSLICCFLIGLMAPLSVNAVNTSPQKREKRELKKERQAEQEMDKLSLIAYISAVGGVASLFIVAPLSLLLLPAAFIMGMIALAGNKKRYEHKRGRALALVALILGGAFMIVFLSSFIIFALSF